MSAGRTARVSLGALAIGLALASPGRIVVGGVTMGVDL